MNTLAWAIVFAYLALTILAGLFFARRAHRGVSDYFLSGQSLPWWLLGTSMVITTFAPDTPVGVAEYARTGLFNGWFGWNMVLQQMLAVFLFAGLWRRSGVRTDNELVELRYSGRPAAGLRLFKALHFSILGNLFTLCIVIAALVEVMQAVVTPEDIFVLSGIRPSPEDLREGLRFGVTAFAVLYALMAGFWGVIATDFLQFFIAMGGTIAFAWIATQDSGGMARLTEAIDPATLAIWPEDGAMQAKILVYVLVMWWGIYNADGGGYLAQRMIAAKDERHASLGALWFSFAYAALRMWPWLVIGSLSLLVFPMIGVGKDASGAGVALINGRPDAAISGRVLVDGTERALTEAPVEVRADPQTQKERVVLTETGETLTPLPNKSAYPKMMVEVLGKRGDLAHAMVLGLLVAAFLAAFMSTVDTLLNWGGSYIVNDVLKRFLWREASDKGLLFASKIFSLAIVTGALFASRHVSSIKDAWIFVWGISAGLGPIVILRWFWWRVNAWSEIAALIASLGCAFLFELLNRIALGPDGYVFAATKTTVGLFGEAPLVVFERWHKILILIGVSLSAGLAATFLGRPAPEAHLIAFVRRVRPPGAWARQRAAIGPAARPDFGVLRILLAWVGGSAVIYGCTFLIGAFVYQRISLGIFATVALVSGGLILWRHFRAGRAAS